MFLYFMVKDKEGDEVFWGNVGGGVAHVMQPLLSWPIGHRCVMCDVIFDAAVAFGHDKSDLRKRQTLCLVRDAAVAYGHDKKRLAQVANTLAEQLSGDLKSPPNLAFAQFILAKKQFMASHLLNKP